jgi:hypothetical protein
VARIQLQAGPGAALERALRVWLDEVVVGYEGGEYIVVRELVLPPIAIPPIFHFHVLLFISALAPTTPVDDMLLAVEQAVLVGA